MAKRPHREPCITTKSWILRSFFGNQNPHAQNIGLTKVPWYIRVGCYLQYMTLRSIIRVNRTIFYRPNSTWISMDLPKIERPSFILLPLYFLHKVFPYFVSAQKKLCFGDRKKSEFLIKIYSECSKTSENHNSKKSVNVWLCVQSSWKCPHSIFGSWAMFEQKFIGKYLVIFLHAIFNTLKNVWARSIIF